MQSVCEAMIHKARNGFIYSFKKQRSSIRVESKGMFLLNVSETVLEATLSNKAK